MTEPFDEAELYADRATELFNGLRYDPDGDDRTGDLDDQTIATIGVGYALLSLAAEVRKGVFSEPAGRLG